jgi:hypothetical protein
MQRVLLRATLGLTTAAMLLLLAEGALALMGIPEPGLYEGDLRTVWWLRPGLDTRQPFPLEDTDFHIETNDLGLRGPLPPEAGDWTLALGCSTTFGWGVPEQAAWPAVASRLIGEPVVNGGVPGWSTHQALLGAQRYLDLKPTRVILGYIVRDAQSAFYPDDESTPTPALLRTHIAGALLSLLQPDPTAAAPALPSVRVPPDRYRDNLSALIEHAEAAGAEVRLLAFPQREPAEPWRSVLGALGHPLDAPALPDDAFFEHDPIHLTVEGHRLLAEALSESLRR